MPKISIIIPTYNSEHFIDRTIKSVINQTYKDWELIIVDDLSKDNTRIKLEKWQNKDSRIHSIFSDKNSGGPALPKNVGIENAKGKYVAFLDHDDEWLPEKLEKQYNLFEQSKNKSLGLVYCFINIIDNNKNTVINYKKNYKGNTIKEIINSNFIVTSSCVMTRLDILKQIGLFDTRFKIPDDWDMWIRIVEAGYEFDFVPEYLINYMVHGRNSSLESKNNDIKNDFLLMYNKHEKYFNQYSFKVTGDYYYKTGKNNVARKWYLKYILSNKGDIENKFKGFAFIILTFLPKFEDGFI
jgi:glycosyltransferase involved in cell wall biosynthesis